MQPEQELFRPTGAGLEDYTSMMRQYLLARRDLADIDVVVGFTLVEYVNWMSGVCTATVNELSVRCSRRPEEVGAAVNRLIGKNLFTTVTPSGEDADREATAYLPNWRAGQEFILATSRF